MPFYDRAGAKIYFETYGKGPPILLLAPGGMKSAIRFWQNAPWDPIALLAQNYHVVVMDQRNAGQSYGAVTAADGWHTYAADQLGLMDHLDIQRFHVAGMCIGGPFALGLIKAAPERVVSATLLQTIGRDNNDDVFYAMFDDWAKPLHSTRDNVSEAAWQSFRENLYGGEQVLFNVDERFLATCKTPLLVLMGNDVYHPESTSRLIARSAPEVTFIERWKSGEDAALAKDALMGFLTTCASRESDNPMR
jgi:pimeloyl-ACP methyl ester carboxylesterase